MSKQAVLYRMSTDDHICPFGLKTRALLKRKGFDVEDHKLSSRAETDQFKEEYDVETTPQVFIEGRRIGGYEELQEYFGIEPANDEGTTYQPVIAIFATCALMALALAFTVGGVGFSVMYFLEAFVALSMCVLAIQKLQDLESFSNQFITYDLLSMRYVRYAYVYPFAEAYAGIGMLGGLNAFLVAPVALFIGGVGAVSVYKAVYIDKRELKCAYVGGDSDVPLGFISLTENLFMIAAGVWMLTKFFSGI
ncbi:MAG: glutaredoxin domain-containing protein [Ketobacteraceae bacterium]|nr:glutaredoxin domain-containing protein [Ketobacteraceae bacterium]